MSNKYNPVAASVSVPPAEREEFDNGRQQVLAHLSKHLGRKVGFSEAVRMLCTNATIKDGNLVIALAKK
jgi:hypothetical protein